MLVGDLNAGSNPTDTEGSALSGGGAFDALQAAGWHDLWRIRSPDAREFTWYSPGARNGFRLDHALLLGAEPDAATHCAYDHSVREDRLSDHSLLEVRVEWDGDERWGDFPWPSVDVCGRASPHECHTPF